MAELTRRTLLKVSVSAGTFVIGYSALQAEVEEAEALFGPWLRLAANGTVTVLSNVADMGQGSVAAFAQIVAEELDVAIESVSVRAAPVGPTYDNPLIRNYATFGSLGVRSNLQLLRNACAAARDMLIKAAATQWNVSVEECDATQGVVRHAASGRTMAFAALAEAAARLTPPDKPALKPQAQWRMIGKPAPRADLHPKVDGSAVYGTDVRLPGMLTAAVAHAPTFGGRLVSVDPAPALRVKGVRKVVPLDDAVAVVAIGYWAAAKGLAELSTVWKPGPRATSGSNELSAELQAAASEGQGETFAHPRVRSLNPPSVAQAFASASRMIDATYEVPFLAHAPMEPMNATALVRKGAAELWLPTQSQKDTQAQVAALLGIEPTAVRLNSTLLGGGFGRRLEQDFALEAVRIAREVEGVPVKLIWSRETDMTAGRYRPAAVARMRMSLRADGMPTALRADMASPSLLEYTGLTNGPPKPKFDWTATMGLVMLKYAVPATHLGWTRVDHGVPCGYWRSVGASQNNFFLETMIDEAAATHGIDPVAYRQRLLADAPREHAFLDALARAANWDKPLPAGHARGIAVNEANQTISGHVVELSLPKPDEMRIHRITAAIDCGLAIDPASVEGQMISGTVFGLSAALAGEVTLREGAVEQRNFDSYPIVTMEQMPPIDVLVVPGPVDIIGGVGEEGVPTIAPAIANAIRALTGDPVRRLPFSRAGYTLVSS